MTDLRGAAPFDLRGKTALVTAAGQGIGRATAQMLLGGGASVVATDIDERSLAGLGTDSLQLDVTDADAIASVAAAVGPVDILVNCAGVVHHGTVLDCANGDWDRAVTLNVTSMFWTIRAWLPAMLERGAGSIINIASVASSISGVPERFAYGTTKAAVIGLTKSVARDFVDKGVRCNAICPGTIATPSLDERINRAGGDHAAREAFVARQPMGRLGRPNEIASLALYLASDQSGFATGQTYVVDGGMTL